MPLASIHRLLLFKTCDFLLPIEKRELSTKIFSYMAMGAALCVPVPAVAQDAQQRVAWNRPIEPFKIVGSVYYVGVEELAAFLVTGPQGHVLIDGGLPESAPLIAANIRKLGFRLRDIKYLLINHAHFDHAGGLAELKRLTGARLAASAGDKPDLEAGINPGRDIPGFAKVKVDRTIRHGEMLKLGSLTLTAHLTPGHTRGCTSWSVQSAGKTVLFACSLTVAGQKLVSDATYPDAAADFRTTYGRLRAMKVDVYLTFHAGFFDMAEKRARQRAGDANAFIDSTELAQRLDYAERAFEAELARQQTEQR